MAARRSVSLLVMRETLGFATLLVVLGVGVSGLRFSMLGRAMVWCQELWKSTSTTRPVYSRLVLEIYASVW